MARQTKIGKIMARVRAKKVTAADRKVLRKLLARARRAKK